jgi:hypothetical protein
VELLFLVPLFVAVGCALAFLQRILGWCVLAPAVLAGCCGRLYRSGLGSSGGSPAKISKTAASPSTCRAFETPFLKDFRLLAYAKLLGAKMAATCLQCALLAAAAVSPKDCVVIFLFFGVSVTGVIS